MIHSYSRLAILSACFTDKPGVQAPEAVGGRCIPHSMAARSMALRRPRTTRSSSRLNVLDQYEYGFHPSQSTRGLCDECPMPILRPLPRRDDQCSIQSLSVEFARKSVGENKWSGYNPKFRCITSRSRSARLKETKTTRRRVDVSSSWTCKVSALEQSLSWPCGSTSRLALQNSDAP